MVPILRETRVERVAARILRSPLTLTAIGPTSSIEPYDAIAARFAL